jgi:mono/diheme cytochrome c family protein
LTLRPPLALGLALLAAATACDGAGQERAQLASRVALPANAEERARGEALYLRHCVQCHGPEASGTERGPPLVHRVYEPRHHSDYAFILAIRQGVRAHHWRFGDMPPVEGITDEEAWLVIAYLRDLQQAAGIF